MDQAGNPSVQFGASSGVACQPDLEEVLAAPKKIGLRQDRRVVVVFDEFQRVLEYDDDTIERAVRSAVQTHEHVAHFFLGSRKHLIQRMFLDAERPLYRSAGHYPLGPIATEDWVPFVRERFAEAEKQISDAHIVALCRLAEGHPFYTQHLAHALWERTPREAAVSADALEKAVDVLLERESYAYTTLWELLTKNHQRFLRGLAAEEEARPFSAEFIQKYGLRTPSNAQRAAESLLEKDVIDRHDGSFLITDRFFRLWVQRL